MRSLQVKFATLLAALLAVACLAVGWVSIRHERSALERELRHRGRALAERLAAAAAPALLADDAPRLEALLGEMGGFPGVAAARVVGRDGRVAASLEPGERGSPPAWSGPVAGKAAGDRIAVPVLASGSRMGEAQVELDLAALLAPVVADAAWRLGLVAGAVVALGVLGGLAFAALLVGPLRRLRAGVERLSAGDLKVRVPPTSGDEVGQLTRAFNEMGESLQHKERIQNAFGRYVNDFVLERLLQAPEDVDLGGVERVLTVLFADIRQFTRLSEGMKAREMVTLLNEVFQLVSDRILARGGTIDKFMGDSVMAYFGAPLAQADHSACAVAAAIDIQRALGERRERSLRGEPADSISINLGIGIHTGVVVVGNLGSDQRMDFTAVGDAVNVAHRLEKLAGPGAILLSEAVQRRVRGAFRLRFVGERTLSGRQEPVHVYAVETDGTAVSSRDPAR